MKTLSEAWREYNATRLRGDIARDTAFKAGWMAAIESCSDGWRTIDSAPREPLNNQGYGPYILVKVGKLAWPAQWDRDFKKFYVEGGHNPMPIVKCWMPLPSTKEIE